MARSQAKKVALTIAGTDPGGGAGIQADLRTFAALGVHGYSAITQVIAQNSKVVERVEPVAPAMIARQIEVVVRERRPDALKIGALGRGAAVSAVVQVIKALRLPAPVVDPVIVSTSGARLLDQAGEVAIATSLIPIARVVTPNISEAERLTGLTILNADDMREAARRIVTKGARAVVIKGGHRGGKESSDLLYDGRQFIEFRSPRIQVEGAHGTGCVFSAAIAAGLAKSLSLEESVRRAKRFITQAIRRSFRLGRGRPLLDI